MKDQFIETRNRYRESMPNVQFPVTYTEWMELPEDQKVPAIFVSFFDLILSTVGRMNNINISEEDMISAITYVLLKQGIKNITGHPEKYTGGYIRTIVKRAVMEYERIQSDSIHNKHNTSNIQVDDLGTEYDLFEQLIADDYEDNPMKQKALDLMSDIIYNRPELTTDLKVVERVLLKHRAIPVAYKYKLATILTELRELLEEPASYITDIRIDCRTFQDVILCENLIESAVVEMLDGSKAIYLGEKLIKRRNSINYVFMGATKDYIVPHNKAIQLRVLEIETIK